MIQKYIFSYYFQEYISFHFTGMYLLSSTGAKNTDVKPIIIVKIRIDFNIISLSDL